MNEKAPMTEERERLAEADETLAEEFQRLVTEFREADDATQGEAWNLLADFAECNSEAILAALRTPAPALSEEELDKYKFCTGGPPDWDSPLMNVWQAACCWTMNIVGGALGADNWERGDGSESIDGDLAAEVGNIMRAAGLVNSGGDTITKEDLSRLAAPAVEHGPLLEQLPTTVRNIARAICKSRTCEGVSCCQWPAQKGRTDCPVNRGAYDDAAIEVMTLRSPPAQAEPRTEKQMLDEAAERVARRSGQAAQAESQEVNLKPGWFKRDMERASARIEEWKWKAESREDIRNAALEEAAKLIEKDFGVQHPLKPLGVSMNFLPGCASRAATIRALKSESRAKQGNES